MKISRLFLATLILSFWGSTGAFSADLPAYIITSGKSGPTTRALEEQTPIVSGTVEGGAYRLTAYTPKLGLTGSGCCCTYLPLILRN